MWENLKPIDLSKIETVPFPNNQYIKEEYPKKQIILHHTISGSGVNGDIESWEATPERIATCIIVDRSGIPWQLFSSKYWAYHLGAGNAELDKQSIGIEIDNWGWLIPVGNGKFRTYYGHEIYVPSQYYPNGFRGYNYYEKYTLPQIQTIGELLLYWKMRYDIPLTYNEDMWGISQKAREGEPGVWGHISFRPFPEKSDPHPQPELIEMLKCLSNIS
jgi:N-acetyl-anhydromuramyl-L-alanine amidase AmpD